MLRYFADAYRALRRTVPTSARTEELTDITSWLGELVRGVDSSLLDEWEALAHPDLDELGVVATGGEVRPPIAARGVTANERGFTRHGPQRDVPPGRAARTAPVRRARRDCTPRRAGAPTAGRTRWPATGTSTTTSASARRPAPPALLMITRSADTWSVRQTFDDPAGDRDWGISADVDLAASDEAGEPVLTHRRRRAADRLSSQSQLRASQRAAASTISGRGGPVISWPAPSMVTSSAVPPADCSTATPSVEEL